MDDDYWKTHQHPNAPAFRKNCDGCYVPTGRPIERQPLPIGHPDSWNVLKSITPSCLDDEFPKEYK